ncbi:hypothetical protein [Sphingomonas sp. S2-65]|uniref:hypothetical protein n=1 Tax=Sphingomonas sp. S2-65 TaxID=2903960 RepID=UPI001F47CEDE|nr:hypothetical protein [Sphingomonas sp. S2-65]UYY60131.1 hypothetical protein LZ586_08655 [Sphingomonas sp. S2-65]
MATHFRDARTLHIEADKRRPFAVAGQRTASASRLPRPSRIMVEAIASGALIAALFIAAMAVAA